MSIGEWRLLWIVVFVTFRAVCVPCLSVDPTQVPGWEPDVSREVRKYVDPDDDAIISGRQLCQDPSTQLLVVVTSIPSSFGTRSAIRETWASDIGSVNVGFIVGSAGNPTVQAAVEEESDRFKDIVQVDLVESYNNLTLKSILLLKWFIRQCPTPRFLMKADDDTYVNVNRLLQRLPAYGPEHNLLGALISGSKPIRDVTHKWYTPGYMYRSRHFPDYLSGSAYVMSRDVAAQLYSAALDTPVLHLEDVYVTGICAQKAGIRRRQFFGFNNQRVTMNCYVITTHGIKPVEMRRLWAQQDTCGRVIK